MQKFFEKSCYCIDCTKEEANNAIDIGCRYLRWGVFPWAPLDHEGEFRRLNSLTNLSNEIVVEFAIPEFVDDKNSGSHIVLSNSEIDDINGALARFKQTPYRINETSPFLKNEIFRFNSRLGEKFSYLEGDLGWAWHFYMAMKAINNGAKAIYISQLNTRLPQNEAGNFITLINAIRDHGQKILGVNVIIGSESIEGVPVSLKLNQYVDFLKKVLDTDKAKKVGGQYVVVDRNGSNIKCMGQSILNKYETEISNTSFNNFPSNFAIDQICVSKNNRPYNENGDVHVGIISNPHSIKNIFWELDGCHNCSWKPAGNFTQFINDNKLAHELISQPKTTYTVWYKPIGDNSTTICYGNIRNGLTTTMQFLSQPKSIRDTFMKYIS